MPVAHKSIYFASGGLLRALKSFRNWTAARTHYGVLFLTDERGRIRAAMLAFMGKALPVRCSKRLDLGDEEERRPRKRTNTAHKELIDEMTAAI